MKWIRYSLFLWLAVMSLFLMSCQNNKTKNAQKNVQQFVKQLEAASEVKEATKKNEIDIKPIKYDGANLRDPFELPTLVKSVKLYPNAILTHMALDNLKLTGIIFHNGHRWAVLRANDGKLYKVTEGMRIGLQQALVAQIDPDRVVFRVEVETGVTNNESMKSRDIVMILQEPKK